MATRRTVLAGALAGSVLLIPGASQFAGSVAFAEQQQFVEMPRLFQPTAGAGTQRAFGQLVGQHVVLNEPGGSLGDHRLAPCNQGRGLG